MTEAETEQWIWCATALENIRPSGFYGSRTIKERGRQLNRGCFQARATTFSFAMQIFRCPSKRCRHFLAVSRTIAMSQSVHVRNPELSSRSISRSTESSWERLIRYCPTGFWLRTSRISPAVSRDSEEKPLGPYSLCRG